MSEHPVDDQGRLLPHPWWPAEREAPGELELVRRFCNSLNRENGADRFATAKGFDRWLDSEGRRSARPDADELATIRTFREAIHAVTVANHERAPTGEAWATIAALLADTTFALRAATEGPFLTAATRSATSAFLGEPR